MNGALIASTKLAPRPGRSPSPLVRPSPPPPQAQPSRPEAPASTLPEFIDWPLVRNHVREESLYGDVINHATKPFLTDGRHVNAHETAHGIHSDLRQKFSRPPVNRLNGFYIPGGKAVLVQEPKLRKSQVSPFLPPALRSYRYNTYISGQKEWDDTPLYIWDEWNAYIIGGEVAIDDKKAGRSVVPHDAVSGCLDFSIYAIALAMAVEKHDPEYWQSNQQFRRFLIWNLQRAEKTFRMGQEIKEFQFPPQDKLLQALRQDPSAEPMRQFIRQHLHGVWLAER